MHGMSSTINSDQSRYMCESKGTFGHTENPIGSGALSTIRDDVTGTEIGKREHSISLGRTDTNGTNAPSDVCTSKMFPLDGACMSEMLPVVRQ